MNRVLSLPQNKIFDGYLETLKKERRLTVITEEGTVRFNHYLGPIEMKFSSPDQQLEPGTRVCVWWKGGGFVCAPVKEVKAEQRKEKRIAERVMQARSQLAAARQARVSGPRASTVGQQQQQSVGAAEPQSQNVGSSTVTNNLVLGMKPSDFTPSLLSI